jgi:hypothetical protein
MANVKHEARRKEDETEERREREKEERGIEVNVSTQNAKTQYHFRPFNVKTSTTLI